MIESLKGITENPLKILERLRIVPEYEDPPIRDDEELIIARSVLVTLYDFDLDSYWDAQKAKALQEEEEDSHKDDGSDYQQIEEK